jgi:hypothetical protein
VCTQPVDVLHESVVHALLSSQLSAAPETHTPPEQASPPVHALPSVHEALLFVWTQPVPVLQVSVVQTLASSQLSAVPAWQKVATQVSIPLHGLLSLQSPSLAQLVGGGVNVTDRRGR